jgi:hypothetical protein
MVTCAPHASYRRRHELGSSAVEYVGLGALSTLLVSGILGVADGAVVDSLVATFVSRIAETLAAGG